MKDKKTESNKRTNDSYFTASSRKNRKMIIKVIIPVVAVAIVLGIVFATQSGQQGTGGAGSGGTGTGDKMGLHVHPMLNVKIDGKSVTLPQNIGISSSLWKDNSLDKYGGMKGMSPLHTHDSTGTIHVESSANRDYTLGEFLDVWGIDLNGKTIKVTVDGQPVSDLRNVVLKDKQQINLDVG